MFNAYGTAVLRPGMSTGPVNCVGSRRIESKIIERLTGKLVGDFLLVVIELFSLDAFVLS